MPSDQIQFTPNAHDVRVERQGWVYYVRGIKRGERFVGGGVTLEGGIVIALLSLVAGRRISGWYEAQPWKVGVVRLRSDGGGLNRTVYKERLPAGVRPAGRIAELVEDVEHGRFHRD